MILTKNSNGEWIQVAGNGKAEYGASTVRTGYLNAENLTEQFSGVTVLDLEHPSVQYAITFSTPMPNNDYIVICDVHNTNLQVEVATANKTKNGFVVTVRNLVATMRADRGETTDGFTYDLIDDYFNYTAFKLYTDTEYNNLLELPDRVETLESEISKTEKTLAIGGSAAAIVKIDVSLPFLETDYGKFTEIDFQVRSDNIRFFISANDGAYLVTAQYNYRSAGWLTGLNYLVNGSKSISLYVRILNYPATVGAKLVFNGLDGAEITEISTVSALPSGSALMKQFPIIYASDLTSTVTSGSTAPITSGGVYSALNNKTSVTATSADSVYIDNDTIYYYPQTKRMLFNQCAFVYTRGSTMPAGRTLCYITIPDGITIPEKGIMIPAMLSVAATDEKLPSAVILNTNGAIVTTNSETNYNYVKIYGVNVFFE